MINQLTFIECLTCAPNWIKTRECWKYGPCSLTSLQSSWIDWSEMETFGLNKITWSKPEAWQRLQRPECPVGGDHSVSWNSERRVQRVGGPQRMLTFCGGLFAEKASVLLFSACPSWQCTFSAPHTKRVHSSMSWPYNGGNDEVPPLSLGLKMPCMLLGTCPAAMNKPRLSLLKEKRLHSSGDELSQLRPSDTSQPQQGHQWSQLNTEEPH